MRIEGRPSGGWKGTRAPHPRCGWPPGDKGTGPPTEQREHIHLRIQRHPFIDLPVHVDCQIWDQEQVAVQIDQTGNHPVSLQQGDPSCCRKRAVKPCRADRPAVLLHIQLDVMFPRQFGNRFDLECRCVAVCGCNHEACRITLWNPKGDQGRTAAGEKVPVSGPQFPRAALMQTGEPR